MEVQSRIVVTELECTGGGFRKGWGPGACGVRQSEVLEDEVRRELQEDTRAGIMGRGRNGRRNRGLELEAREELISIGGAGFHEEG